jgi:hypothetical protein
LTVSTKITGGFPRHLAGAALCRFLILVERNKVAAMEGFMVHKWIFAILLGSAAASGQTTVIHVFPAELNNESKVTIIPKVHVVQRYDKLRLGQDELVAITWDDLPNCHQCRSSQFDRSFVMGSLQLALQEGFTIQYAQGEMEKPVSFNSPVWKTTTYVKTGFINLIKIRANRDVPLGDYTIRGKITLIRIEDGVYHHLLADVSIPVTVVEKNAKIHKTSWHYDPEVDRHIKSTLTWIAIAPALPFLLIYLEIACRGERCS